MDLVGKFPNEHPTKLFNILLADYTAVGPNTKHRPKKMGNSTTRLKTSPKEVPQTATSHFIKISNSNPRVIAPQFLYIVSS